MFARKGLFSSIGRSAVMATVAAADFVLLAVPVNTLATGFD